MSTMLTPSHNLCPKGHEIWNLCWPSLGYHYMYMYNVLSLSDICSGVENYFYEIHHFFLPQYLVVLWYLSFYVLYPYWWYIPNFVHTRICPEVLENKRFTHEESRLTLNYSNMSPDWLYKDAVKIVFFDNLPWKNRKLYTCFICLSIMTKTLP